ncbi:hypothetical protein [Marinimicrobium sp. ABcell2]|uniref:hypothetical protein n=1 Tax=Marinimicrobium sp. ABcell2 TaxID=3069751 RepID=UPI0027B7F4C1|nr:hypothetical protein [Marinimicrobium sp. ABcell2]MDQ2077797.1 hypothetical protein [Marinimicrobium sp. ABcell2]
MRGLGCCLLLLVAAPLICAAETVVEVEGEQIIYRGGLTQEANDRAFELFDRQEIKPATLTITSPGGAIHLGLELGEWVHRNGLDVKVYELCFSSCANYVFPAGRRKLLGENAIVGFHGGATSDRFDMSSLVAILEAAPESERERIQKEVQESLESYIKTNEKREAEFYQRLGISPKLNVLGQSESLKEVRKGCDGWVYTVEDMKTLGLANVEIINDPRPSELDPKPKVFTVKLAPESTLMEPVGLPVYDEQSHASKCIPN